MAGRDRHFHIHSEEPVFAKLNRNGDTPALWREVKIPAATQGLSFPSDLVQSTPVFDCYSHDKGQD